jgi:hypothetical protein
LGEVAESWPVVEVVMKDEVEVCIGVLLVVVACPVIAQRSSATNV